MVAIENVNLDDLPTTPDVLAAGCHLHREYQALQAAGAARLTFARSIDVQRRRRADAQTVVENAHRDPAGVEDWRAVAAARAQVEAIDAWLPGQQARMPAFDDNVAAEQRRWEATWAAYLALLQLVQQRTATLPQYDESGRLLGWEPLPAVRLAQLHREIEEIRNQRRPDPMAIRERDEEIAHMMEVLGIGKVEYQAFVAGRIPQPVAAAAAAQTPGW